jgi:hypothetical protein
LCPERSAKEEERGGGGEQRRKREREPPKRAAHHRKPKQKRKTLRQTHTHTHITHRYTPQDQHHPRRRTERVNADEDRERRTLFPITQTRKNTTKP